MPELWLALRHGSVTIRDERRSLAVPLWLALRHGSVTIGRKKPAVVGTLWLALRHGSVTIIGQSNVQLV